MKLNSKIIRSAMINNLAYELEQSNPDLNFYEVNALVQEKLDMKKWECDQDFFDFLNQITQETKTKRELKKRNSFGDDLSKLANEPFEETVRKAKAIFGNKPTCNHLKLVK